VLHTSVTFTTAGNNGRGRLFVQTALANATATTVTFGDAGDQTTGNHVHIYRVTNMKRVGLDAVRQTARDDSHAAGIPQVTALTVAALAQNPTLVFVHDEGTAAAPYTAPTGWTEPTSPVGEGVSTVPTERSESASRDSGFTGTTVTWGTTSVGVYGSLVVELNADPNGPPPPKLPFIQSINHFSPI
jgi:hypothetical protein